jgi:hypothetical protein
MLALKPQLIEIITWNGMLKLVSCAYLILLNCYRAAAYEFMQIMASLIILVPLSHIILTMDLLNGLRVSLMTAGEFS